MQQEEAAARETLLRWRLRAAARRGVLCREEVPPALAALSLSLSLSLSSSSSFLEIFESKI
jgi:hypothetical protein